MTRVSLFIPNNFYFYDTRAVLFIRNNFYLYDKSCTIYPNNVYLYENILGVFDHVYVLFITEAVQFLVQ